MSEKSLTQRSARGGVNALGGQAAKIVLGLASLSILARMLSPEDYGLMAMALTIIGIAEVFKDFGLSGAIIQAKTLSEQERTNLWWVNLGIGTILCLIVAALSPFVAWFYQNDQLLNITAILSLNFVLSGASVQYFAHLSRDMQFGKIAFNNIVSNILGIVFAVSFASQGFGVWSLVIQSFVISLSSLILVVLQTRWYPGWYDSSVSIKSFISFGFPLMLSNLLNQFNSVVDSLLIGKLAGASTLGYYNRAFQAVRTPMNGLRSPLSSVAYSALSKNQEDHNRLRIFAEKGQIVLGYPLALVGGGFAAASMPLVLLVLGSQWEGATVFFAWLAIAESLNCLALTAGWIFFATGHSKAVFNLTLFSSINRLVFILFGFILMGPVGLVVGQAFAVMIQWPLSLLWTEKVTSVPTHGLMVNSYRIFAVVTFSSLITYTASGFIDINLFVDLLLLVLIQLLAAASCALVPAVRKDYLVLLGIVRQVRN